MTNEPKEDTCKPKDDKDDEDKNDPPPDMGLEIPPTGGAPEKEEIDNDIDYGI